MAKKKKAKQRRYPWDKWFAKKKFTLKRGREFDCMTHCMGVMARRAASVRDVTISIHHKGEDTLWIEVGD